MNRLKRTLASWTTRELLVTVVIALAIGIVSIPLRLATSALGITFGPLVSVPLSSYVVLGGCFVAYVIRRPLAVSLSQIIVGLVLSVTMPAGIFLIVLYIIHAIAIELPFAVTRYKRFGFGVMAAAGGIARLLILAAAWLAAGLQNSAVLVQVGLVLGALVGGAIGGVLAKLLGDALAKTGVVSLGLFDVEDEMETA
ncbi:MAG: ECF transporter S component [Chloroflexota bacterium]